MSSNLVDLGRKLLDACRNGHTDNVLVLTQSGAPFTTDWLGTSPLHLAARYGHAASAEILLKAGVTRDARTKLDRTALHVAAQEGHLQMVELLLAHGADSNARDMLKMTPLHWAVQRCHISIVERLLIGGSDPTVVSKFCVTPSDMAEELGYLDILRLLQNWTKNIGINNINNINNNSNVSRVNQTPVLVTRSPRVKTGVSYTNGDVIKKNKLQMNGSINLNQCIKLELNEKTPNRKHNISTANITYSNNQMMPSSPPIAMMTTTTTSTTSVATNSSVANLTDSQNIQFAHIVKPQTLSSYVGASGNVDLEGFQPNIKIEPNTGAGIHDNTDSRRVLIANLASSLVPDTVDTGWFRSAVVSNDVFSQCFFRSHDHLDGSDLTEDDFDPLDLILPDTVDALNFDDCDQ